ncbi:Demethylrebeccamycin-D-glucose O-methyltransferase [invertebrate metagenome]|uniref:Demethylrebeccamycin-D-glucose O-methyltransferase n=1 Tax=invertebrate metagenome TaxID=1711999 RepID=A0A2H9T5Y7_9ZZZZ
MKKNINATTVLDTNRRFHDEVEAGQYDNRMGVKFDAASRQQMIGELEKVAGCPLPREGIVLDVAAGTGNLSVNLAATGWFRRVIAVDISRNSLEVARKNAHEINARITPLCSDMQPLPLKDNTIDLIVGCAFLHHLPDPVQFMKEIYRVLKPGCPFIIVGEPTHIGAMIINGAKTPLVFLNTLKRWITHRPEKSIPWKHHHIDVHCFTKKDTHLLVESFSAVRIITEGFFEPIISQSFLVPIRTQINPQSWLHSFFQKLSFLSKKIDSSFLGSLIPGFCRTTLKLSGKKPSSFT